MTKYSVEAVELNKSFGRRLIFNDLHFTLTKSSDHWGVVLQYLERTFDARQLNAVNIAIINLMLRC